MTESAGARQSKWLSRPPTWADWCQIDVQLRAEQLGITGIAWVQFAQELE